MNKKLKISATFQSVAGIKPDNEDCAGIYIPDEDYLRHNKGVVIAIADGVSSAEEGREASETTINRFINEYYKTPDTWSVATSGQNVLSTLNLHLYRKSHEYGTETKGFLTTFSAIVFKGHTAHFFHVGDSRIYLCRDSQFLQKTTDHSASFGEGRTGISRAIGMDSSLNVDYGKIALKEGDRFLLTTDGVHDFIDEHVLKEKIEGAKNTEKISEDLVNLALNNNSNDNVSALVAFVNELPDEEVDDYQTKLEHLPFPPDLSVGMTLDGYHIEKELFASSRSQVFLVRDEESNEVFAMKTPSINYEGDMSYITRFIREEWVGSRVNSPYIVKIIKQTKKRRFLYYLMEFVEGISLDKWMSQHRPPSPKQAIKIVKGIAKGLTDLHNNETVHQDLKPANVIIKEDLTSVLLDFGSVFVSGLAELSNPLEKNGVLGTASYSDPLYLQGKEPSFQGDVYSLGCITYELFTGHLPYSEKIEECRSAFDYDQLRYEDAFNYNPIVPKWFNGALEKAVAFDLEDRYSTIEDMLHDLTQPNPEFLKDDPVIEKKSSQLLFWKLLSGFWFVTFLVLIYLFSVGD